MKKMKMMCCLQNTNVMPKVRLTFDKIADIFYNRSRQEIRRQPHLSWLHLFRCYAETMEAFTAVNLQDDVFWVVAPRDVAVGC
jgi:hypothetical protein